MSPWRWLIVCRQFLANMCVCVFCVLCVCCVCGVCVVYVCVLCVCVVCFVLCVCCVCCVLRVSCCVLCVLPAFRRTALRRTAQHVALFFSLSRPIFALFVFLWGSARGMLVVFEAPGGVKCARLEFSGCRVKPRHNTHRTHSTHTTHTHTHTHHTHTHTHSTCWPKTDWPKMDWPKSVTTC